MQTTAIRTVANSLPEKGVILLTLLISDRYILFAEFIEFICKNLVYRSQCNLIKRIIIVLGKNFFCHLDWNTFPLVNFISTNDGNVSTEGKE